MTVLLLVALTACTSAPAPSAHASATRRIVVLMPSFSDDLCAFGAGRELVGVSQFTTASCARNLPRVNDATSVDSERIIALHPDLVVGIPAQRIAVTPLQRAGIHVLLIPDDSYSDLLADVGKLGAVSGDSAEAQRLVRSLRARTQALERSEHFQRRPSVFVVVQTTPIWTVGPQSYISSLIAFAGGRNAVISLPQAYAQFSPEALLRLQPDALLASRDAQLTDVLDREPWRSLNAVRRKHVFIINDASLLYRPGPNYNQAVAWLSAQLRPIAR